MKEIFIRRYEVDTFLKDYPELVSNSTQKIGSIMQSAGGPLRGLSFEDEKKYLSKVIGVDPNDPKFSKQATDYWYNFSIPVPITGVKLNITTDENGDPLNVADWIKYQFILKHPEVESSKGAADSNVKARFYIHDPDEEVERQNKATKLRLEAGKELVKVLQGTDSEERLEQLTRVLISQNPNRLTRPQIENLLAEFAHEKPGRFLSAVNDKSLELHDLVLQLTETNVVQKIGQQYRYNDQTIAGTLEEMIAFLANNKNSRILGEMRAKLQEAKRLEVA